MTKRKKVPRIDDNKHDVMIAKKKAKIKNMVPVRVDSNTLIFVEREADKEKAVERFVKKINFYRDLTFKKEQL